MQQTIKCDRCDRQNQAGMNFCIYCGARLGTLCQNCGAIVPPDSRFCPSCAALTGMGRFGKHQDKVEDADRLLRCVNCGTENESGKRFCRSCGAKLVIPCPVCHNINVMPSGYCPDCGKITVNGKK